VALPLAWLGGTKAAQWWLATVSRAARSRVGAEAIAEAEGESEHEEETVEEDFAATTCDGIRMYPRGMVATGGVWSPSHHNTQCHAHMRW
jgi:hypothetical protein